MATRVKEVARRSSKKYVEEALYRRLFRRGSTPQAVREEVDGFVDSRKRALKWEVGVCVCRLRRYALYRPALKIVYDDGDVEQLLHMDEKWEFLVGEQSSNPDAASDIERAAVVEEEMTGKGQRRREKNYRAAHGADTRLPPPPKQRELDALPSKLRRLIAFQNKQNSSAKADADVDASSGGNPGKQGDDGAGKNKARKDKKSKKWALEPPADAKAAKIRGEDGPVADENMNADGSKGKRKQGK